MGDARSPGCKYSRLCFACAGSKPLAGTSQDIDAPSDTKLGSMWLAICRTNPLPSLRGFASATSNEALQGRTEELTLALLSLLAGCVDETCIRSHSFIKDQAAAFWLSIARLARAWLPVATQEASAEFG